MTEDQTPKHKAVVCDLDGCLAIRGDRSPFDASKCDLLDKPNVPVVECVRAMAFAGYDIIFMSAREEKDRAPTERFIQNVLPELTDWLLFMRTTGDYRKDAIVKWELWEQYVLPNYDVLYALDDRLQVIQALREHGVTVFDVAGNTF